MYINFSDCKIVMTKAESIAAGVYENVEYKALMNLRKDFPNYQIAIKSPKRKKDSFKGLTFEYMENYIEKHDNEEKSIMREFRNMRGEGNDGVILEARTYGEIKMWFLDQYPIFEQTNKDISKNLDTIKRNRALKRTGNRES